MVATSRRLGLGAGKVGQKRFRVAVIVPHRFARDRLERLDSHVIRPWYRAVIDAKLAYLRRRRAMSTSLLIRLPAIAGELLLCRYHQYAWSGKADLLSDLKTLSVARRTGAS